MLVCFCLRHYYYRFSTNDHSDIPVIIFLTLENHHPLHFNLFISGMCMMGKARKVHAMICVVGKSEDSFDGIGSLFPLYGF